MVPGVHRDEPACDGSQLVSRTGQRTEGKTVRPEYFLKLIVLFDQSYSPAFTRRWTGQERPSCISRGLQSYRYRHQLRLCCLWVKWPRAKFSHVSLSCYYIFYYIIFLSANFCKLKFSMFFVWVFVCLQVTTMVLCQCSQRCSWCAKREDYSYPAPPLLSVRFNFSLPAYVPLVDSKV